MTPADLPFVQHLMALPALSLHKPDPTPPKPDDIARHHKVDLLQWARLGYGRYLVEQGARPVGLCGLRPREGWAGLNISYHLHPDFWGRGWASLLVTGLIDVARAMTPIVPSLHGLARPGNPASGRVLQKAGFTHTRSITLGGAPTDVYVLDLTT